MLASSSTNSGSKSVTGTSSIIVPANVGSKTGNKLRKILIITNCDAGATVYIGIGFVPTSTDFTYKIPSSATIHLDMCQFSEELNAISSAGTVNVRIYEGVQ